MDAGAYGVEFEQQIIRNQRGNGIAKFSRTRTWIGSSAIPLKQL